MNDSERIFSNGTDSSSWSGPSHGFSSDNVPVVTRLMSSDNHRDREYAGLLIGMRRLNAERKFADIVLKKTASTPQSTEHSKKYGERDLPNELTHSA